MRFDLSQYATVEERLVKFWQDHPDGAIITEIAHREGDTIIFKAYIYFERGGELVSTGFAEEVKDASPVNKTSYVENAETSSIGRGLANANYAMKKRPSREEMQKAERRANTTTATTVTNIVSKTTTDPEAPIVALITPQQRETMGKLAKETGRNKGFMKWASQELGREIAKVDDMTRIEATTLIGLLIRIKADQQ
jgi:hypothetical protein